ncbi:hypothetical protein MNEG_5124 [Monoraphidium neglectum]|uniref:Uncharacterized protein n=1 Tax=Monoraphidium neglectum TaxID=145388 RepID=A0A0D2MIG9_9CHLO|nr:hypothetical protein MNEG_5124 [Monoraphidium neglectum]KIZ02835.1 hypothetical protein MNEG_5124 [Monoraphidium neglectum]|eukprot:XP_013901854.1 hypothetical protein MNEG_5124 [Monoraphidium neglectum]
MLQLAGGIQGVALLTQGGAACLRLAHALQQQRARPCDAQAACRHMYTRAGQAHETPSIIPDGGPAGVTAGRSSEVNSVRPVGDPRLRRLVDDVFTLYETRDPGAQRSIVRRHYAPNATYQNNIMRVQGAEAIMRRFSLLPKTTQSVRIVYEPPVELGATSSSPDALGNLGFKGDLEVEIKNSQTYVFQHPGMLRFLVVGGRSDVELPVLTRLALDKGSLAILHHQDVWLNKAAVWGPLRKGWGAVATTMAGSPPLDDPGRQPQRPRRGEEGEQSEEGEEESRERVGEQGRRGGRREGGKGGEDSGLRRAPPGVEPVPAA